jgi:hypothetical protein
MHTYAERYRLIVDPGHSWLEVPARDFNASGAEVSEFSYVNMEGTLYYLEEDCDAGRFCRAAFGRETPPQYTPTHIVGERGTPNPRRMRRTRRTVSD